MESSSLNFIGHSIHLTILYYGCVKFFGSWIWGCLPSGLLIAMGITAFFYYIRVPSPSKEQVEAILGKDLPDINPEEKEGSLQVIAHRGAGIDAPENTLAAFKYCKEQKCSFIELDVCLTSDGVPVIFHDTSTGRLAEEDLEVSKSSWANLKKLNLSSKHPHKELFNHTRIATLEETVAQLLADDQKMFIDVKHRDPKLVKVILDIFEKYPQLYSRALVTSFFASMIYRIRSKNPRIVAAVAWTPEVIYYASKVSSQGGPMWEKILLQMFDVIHEWLLPRFTYAIVGFSVILLNQYCVNRKSVYEWRKRGIRVIAWTLNQRSEKQYCNEILKIPYLTDTLKKEDPVNALHQMDLPKNYYTY